MIKHHITLWVSTSFQICRYIPLGKFIAYLHMTARYAFQKFSAILIFPISCTNIWQPKIVLIIYLYDLKLYKHRCLIFLMCTMQLIFNNILQYDNFPHVTWRFWENQSLHSSVLRIKQFKGIFGSKRLWHIFQIICHIDQIEIWSNW